MDDLAVCPGETIAYDAMQLRMHIAATSGQRAGEVDVLGLYILVYSGVQYYYVQSDSWDRRFLARYMEDIERSTYIDVLKVK